MLIGTLAIKEQSISIEEVHHHMEELDHVVSAFNDAHAALGNLYPFFSTLFIHYLPYYID
jgi:hypothetical protein